jgi:PLP dependent protein
MIGDRLASIRQRMDQACARAGRDPADVALLAVSKAHGVDAILEAYAAGLRRFGENYVQSWQGKAEDPRILKLSDLDWRFIGHLQRNKVKFLLGRVDVIETVDSLRLARAIAQKAAARGARQAVLLQINVGGEDSKSGVSPEHAGELLGALPQGLDVRGLMAIPPPRPDAESTRPDHRFLRELRDRLQDEHSVALPELSMGMSGDFEVAIEEGSTEVRIGTALFGARATPPTS